MKLPEAQAALAAAAINKYGEGDHPLADLGSLEFFNDKYVVTCLRAGYKHMSEAGQELADRILSTCAQAAARSCEEIASKDLSGRDYSEIVSEVASATGLTWLSVHDAWAALPTLPRYCSNKLTQFEPTTRRERQARRWMRQLVPHDPRAKR